MTRFVEFLEFPYLDWNPVCFTHRNSLSFCVLNCVDQRERWLKPARVKSVWVCRREAAWESRDCRNAKRSLFVFVLLWVYFEHERFESGFRDLTVCVKVLRFCLLFYAVLTSFSHVLREPEPLVPYVATTATTTTTQSTDAVGAPISVNLHNARATHHPDQGTVEYDITTLTHWETRNKAGSTAHKMRRGGHRWTITKQWGSHPRGIKSRQRNAKQQEGEEGAPQAVLRVRRSAGE